MCLVSACSCLCEIYWSQVLSGEWRCSWSSADRQCSNYNWVINNIIAYFGASYIRDLTVLHFEIWSSPALSETSDIMHAMENMLWFIQYVEKMYEGESDNVQLFGQNDKIKDIITCHSGYYIVRYLFLFVSLNLSPRKVPGLQWIHYFIVLQETYTAEAKS